MTTNEPILFIHHGVEYSKEKIFKEFKDVSNTYNPIIVEFVEAINTLKDLHKGFIDAFEAGVEYGKAQQIAQHVGAETALDAFNETDGKEVKPPELSGKPPELSGKPPELNNEEIGEM